VKVLIIINTLRYGGAEKQVIADANALAAAGHHVTIGCHESGELARRLSQKIRLFNIGSSNVGVASVLLFLHLLSNRYDVIHSHMFWAERVSVFPGKITGHKVVFNEHGLGLWRKWYHVIVMRLISFFADKVVTSCEENYRIRMEKEGIRPDKMVVIYNSFEENSGRSNSTASYQDFRDGKFTIGYAGRFDAVKRLDIFLEIAERLKQRDRNFRIVLLGDGDLKRGLEKQISARSLKEYFRMPGFVLDPSHYYEGFDVFVLPSKVEGFSLALLEAGASRVPLIAFDVGGNSEIISDGVNGFTVPDNDTAALVERIEYLLKHDDIRREMGITAHRVISNRFSLARRIHGLQELYRSLM